MSELIRKEAFTVLEGRPVTSSLIVAEYFEKEHRNVLRDIRAIIAKKAELAKDFYPHGRDRSRAWKSRTLLRRAARTQRGRRTGEAL